MTNPKPPGLFLSLHLYRLLLLAYPSRFRQGYGSQMLQLFQDCCLRALGQRGAAGLLNLWAITLLDFLRSVLEQHLHKEADVSRSQLIKISGWAFLLGSFGFLGLLLGSDVYAIPGAVISSILLAVGMLGLRAHYGEKVGRLGRDSLMAGAIAVVVYYILLLAIGLLIRDPWTLRVQFSRGAWVLFFGGPAVALPSLAIFGLAALRSKPLPRLNWLPALAGLLYPLVFLYGAAYVLTHNGSYIPDAAAADPLWGLLQSLALLALGLQFLSLFALGLMLITDTRPQIAAA
jgi:hypothetical protein